MALKDIIDVVGCSIADSLGTGARGCDFNFENLESIALIPQGDTIPASATYDRSYIRDLQAQGKWIPLNNAYSFEWQTTEDEVETSETKGVEAVTRKGLYKLNIMFRSGLYHQKILNSLEGFGRWDVIMFDEDGNQLHVSNTGGGIRGFRTGRFSASPIQFKNGTNSLKTQLTIQFIKAVNFNKDVGFIGANDLTFNPEEIDGVNQARLTIPVAPANSATGIVVKTVLDKDGSTFTSGYSTSSFLIKNQAGATITVSGAVPDTTNKTYTLTVPSMTTGEVYTVSLYDSSNSRAVIAVGSEPDDILYKAKDVSTTVVA